MKVDRSELVSLLETIDEFIDDVITERKIREVDITSGKAQHGSNQHIADLKTRIEDLTAWRNKQPKGSASRENYGRLVSRLRSELKSAIRANEKSKPKKHSLKAK